MSITDELREWFEHAYNYGSGEDMFKKYPCPWFGWKGDIEPMLDRIDEQHRRALERVAAMVDEPDEIERRVKALEHLTEGMLLDESELRERVEKVERKLNHKGER